MVSPPRERLLPRRRLRAYSGAQILFSIIFILLLSAKSLSFSFRGSSSPPIPPAPTPRLANQPTTSSLIFSFFRASHSLDSEMGSDKKEGRGRLFAHFLPPWLKKGSQGSRPVEGEEHHKEKPEKKANDEHSTEKTSVEAKTGREWDYNHQGADWAPPVLACGISCKRQSPIEIDPEALGRLLKRCKDGEVDVEEKSAAGNKMMLATAELLLGNALASAAPLKKEQVMFDSGYKLQLKPSDNGAFGELERGEGDKAEKYQVVQFHFHAPSEHTLGSRCPLELHIVCKCMDEGKQDQLLVLGIFFQEGDQECAFLKACEGALAASLTEDARAHVPQRVLDALNEAEGEKEGCVDLKSLLPADAILIAYEGSLTTPPCTENVHW